MAEKEINESGGRIDGANLARIGKILGWIGVALGVLFICCMLIFFVFIPFFAVTSSTTSSLLPILLPFGI